MFLSDTRPTAPMVANIIALRASFSSQAHDTKRPTPRPASTCVDTIGRYVSATPILAAAFDPVGVRGEKNRAEFYFQKRSDNTVPVAPFQKIRTSQGR